VALAPNMGQMIVDGIHSIIERNINESAEVAP
jgi:hypothetical protein